MTLLACTGFFAVSGCDKPGGRAKHAASLAEKETHPEEGLEGAVKLYLEELQLSGARQWTEASKAPETLQRMVLPVAGKEKLVLLRSSLDGRVSDAEPDVPVPEQVRVYVSDKNGVWRAEPASPNGIIEGYWQFRREQNGRMEYGLFWSRRGADRHRFEIYSASDGAVTVTDVKELPGWEEQRDKSWDLNEEDFAEWVRKSRAPPEGLSPFEPEREWILTADWIKSSQPVWKKGVPAGGK